MSTRSRSESGVPAEIRDGILGAASSAATSMVEGEPAIWTPDEQAALERSLTAMDPSVSTLRRAALVAAELPGKSLRDVVQRISALQDCMPEATAAAAAVSSATALQAGLSSSGVVYDALGNPDFQGADSEQVQTEWTDPSSVLAAKLNIARSTMDNNTQSVEGGGPAGGAFPHELQVSQLLQENMLIVARMRANLQAAQMGENVALMHKFHVNMNAVLSMVASLKVNVPPLPVAPNKTFINSSAIPPPSHGLYPNTRPSIDPSNTGPGGGGSLASTPAGAINALPPEL